MVLLISNDFAIDFAFYKHNPSKYYFGEDIFMTIVNFDCLMRSKVCNSKQKYMKTINDFFYLFRKELKLNA